MAKLDRNRCMYFASFDGTSWEVIGRDNDDLTKELNPDTETSRMFSAKRLLSTTAMSRKSMLIRIMRTTNPPCMKNCLQQRCRRNTAMRTSRDISSRRYSTR